jgi:hypothetical protein
VYLPALRGLRKAGYGVGSGDWVPVGEAARFKGGSRLGVLPAGVLKAVLAAGVASWAYVADRVLSLLRERFDEAGETGIELGADMMPVTAGSVRRDAPLRFALRLSARSLCSVMEMLSVSRRTWSPGR